MIICPNCKCSIKITKFGGLEKENGKIIICLCCDQKFIIFERYISSTRYGVK